MKKRQKEKKPPDSKKKQGTQKRTLGPVPHLEEYVKPDWWREIFNELYLKTDGDVVGDQAITEREVSEITEILNINPDGRILDLCCGQGRHALEFARRGYETEGLDRSHYLIQKARSLARKEGLNVRFREGNAKKIPYKTDSFDAVTILGNSFGYFETVQEDLQVLREVKRVLKPWGKLILDIADGEYLREHYQPRSWEWIDANLFVCRERGLSLDGQRLVSREVVTDVRKGVIADQFYAERLYSRDSIKKLLDTAGFSGVKFHDIETASLRGQDLGMMERRYVVTAVIRKEWTPVKTRDQKRIIHVAVIMGDPQKPDPVKPDCTFDEDDFITIDRMKEALATLKGYRFIFLNNHEILITDLTKLKGKIDYILNLCDEGYNNDAKKELHIPSLLEMIGIPYSGAGPQALAKCYDKSLVRGIARELGVPVPEGLFVNPGDRIFEIPFGFPVIVKPNCGDSSIGITQKSVASSIEELSNAITTLRSQLGYDLPLLIEEFLTGNDVTVGIIGNPPDSYMVLPVGEEDYSALPPGLPRICGYEAKWLPESPYWKITSRPAELPPETEKMIIRCCLLLFERLECRDYCRFDLRLSAYGQPKLLEVNPNPGWCWDGHLAKMAKYAGISYADMFRMILRATERRLGLFSEPLATGEQKAEAALADTGPG